MSDEDKKPVAAPETPKAAEPVTVESIKKSAEKHITKLGVRFNKAFGALVHEKSVFDKMAGVFMAFAEDIDEVSDEEKKQKAETAAKVGTELLKSDTKDIVAAAVADAPETPDVVKDFYTVAVDAARTLDAERAKDNGKKSGETFATLASMTDKADSAKNDGKDKKLETFDTGEKRLMACYGIRFLVELKKKFTKDGDFKKEDFKKALDEFDAATKNTGRSFQILKSDHFKNIWKSGGSSWDAFEPLRDKLGLPLVNPIGMSLNSLKGSLQKPLNDNEAAELQKYFVPLFPKTSDADRAKVVQILSQIISSESKFPTNEQVAELAFHLDNDDLLELSKTLAG